MEIIITIADKDTAAIFEQLKQGSGWSDGTQDELAANLAADIKREITTKALRGKTYLDRAAAEVAQLEAKTVLEESVTVAVKAE